MGNNTTVGVKSNFQTLTGVPDNQKLKAAELNQIVDFQKAPAQQITGSLDDTDIVIDGTKQYSVTIVEAGATRTITANASGHFKGNFLIQRYTFDVNCTITLSGVDSIGNNTGTITPIPAGTYDFIFYSRKNGINLLIDVNTASSKETIKIPIGAADTDHTTGTINTGIHIDYDFTFVGLPTLEFNPIIADGGPTGTSFIVDINISNIDGSGTTSALSTKLSVDAGEFHSSTAATPAVLSITTIAQYKYISIDIDQIGGTIAGKGGFVTLNGFRT